VHGPSIPTLMNLDGEPLTTPGGGGGVEVGVQGWGRVKVAGAVWSEASERCLST